jgi:hypothetical protein
MSHNTPSSSSTPADMVCVRVTGLRKAVTWNKPGDHPLVSSRVGDPTRGFIPTNPNSQIGEISVDPGDVLISARDSLVITEVIPKRLFHKEWLEISLPEDPKQGAVATNVLARILSHNALQGSIDRLQGLDVDSKKYMQEQLRVCLKSAFFAGAYNQSFGAGPVAAQEPVQPSGTEGLPPPPLRIIGQQS